MRLGGRELKTLVCYMRRGGRLQQERARLQYGGRERAAKVGVLHEKRVRATAGERAATEERYSFALQCGYSYV